MRTRAEVEGPLQWGVRAQGLEVQGVVGSRVTLEGL